MKLYEHTEQITAEQALVLQQIDDGLEETPAELGRALRFSPAHLAGLLQALHRRGLVSVSNASGQLYVELSRKGKRLMRTVWPESSHVPGRMAGSF